MTKRCNACGKVGKFCKKSASKDGYQSECIECNRKRKAAWRKKRPHIYHGQRLMREFGISYETFDLMLIGQNHRCAICYKHQSELTKTLAVDHDHTTGKIRGLLCNNCNRGIGHLKDSEEILSNAIRYLRKD